MSGLGSSQQPSLSGISCVVEVVSGTFVGDTDYLNAHLDAGWELLAIASAGHKPLYSLGWHRSKGAPVFPEKPKSPFADLGMSDDGS